MAILGNGDIAKVLKDRKDLIYFACGVSNSQERNEGEYWRELRLLNNQDKTKHIVYFSTLSIYYNKNRYTQHKINMEKWVKTFASYTIIRIGNISWGKNPHTLLNYLKANPKAKRKDVTRYIVDKKEFLHWVNKIRVGVPDIINIPGKQVNVKTL